MAVLKAFSGFIYDNQAFKDRMNANYLDEAAMAQSVKKLQASPLIDIETMEFGQYQPILSDSTLWPNDGGKRWWKEVGHARMQLTVQPNDTPLSKDEAGVIPLTRCALLDACVRKCFNSTPLIPMTIDVRQKKMIDIKPDQHDILLVWEYGNGDKNPPTRLNLTMVCPYRATPKPLEGSR